MVELEMLELDADNKYVILTGDFNTRTGTDLEFFDIDNARNYQFELWKMNCHYYTMI